MRGLYANLTILGTWRKFRWTFLVSITLLTCCSIPHLGLGHLCENWPRKVAGPWIHLRPNHLHWLSLHSRGIAERQGHRPGFPDVLFHQPAAVPNL